MNRVFGVTIKRKMSMKGNRNYTHTSGKISDHWRSNCCLKIDSEGDINRGGGNCYSISQYQQKIRRSCVEHGLVLAVMGGWRSQMGWSQFHFWKSWRPGWCHLRGVRVPVRRGWAGEAFPHMARDEYLSLAVMLGAWSSLVGLYELSVLGRT